MSKEIQTTQVTLNGNTFPIPVADLEWFVNVKGAKEVGAEEKLKNVAEMTELINSANTVDEVNAIVGDDDRKGVLSAATKKINELNK